MKNRLISIVSEKDSTLVKPTPDLKKEIQIRFPDDEEARQRYSATHPWQYKELRAIRGFEFHFKEAERDYKPFCDFKLWIYFHSFGKQLPIKIEFELTSTREICGIIIHSPSYLYPEIEDDLERMVPAELKPLEGTDIKLETMNLDIFESPETADCLRILTDLFTISNDSTRAVATDLPPPSPPRR